jgi:hypothetical protein
VRPTKWTFLFLLVLTCSSVVLAQTGGPSKAVVAAQTGMAASEQSAEKSPATLDARREKRAIQVFLESVQTQIVSAADAMPAVKYGFTPTDGEFKGGVRTCCVLFFTRIRV